jgi:hypothetical protein
LAKASSETEFIKARGMMDWNMVALSGLVAGHLTLSSSSKLLAWLKSRNTPVDNR